MRPAVSRSTEVPSRGSALTAPVNGFSTSEADAASSSTPRSPAKEYKKVAGIDRIMTDDILRPIGETRRRGGGSGRGRDSSSSTMTGSCSTVAPPQPIPSGQSENLFSRRLQSYQGPRSARGAATVPPLYPEGGFLGVPAGGISQLLSPLTLSLMSIQGSGREPTPLTLQPHANPSGTLGSRPGTSPGASRSGGPELASGFNWGMLDSVDIPVAHSKHVLRMTLRGMIEHSANSQKNSSASPGNPNTGYNRDTLYSELMAAYQWAIADYAKTSRKRFQDGLLPTSTNLPGRISAPTPTPPQPPIPLPSAAVRSSAPASARASLTTMDHQMIDWEVPSLKGSRVASSARVPTSGGTEFLFQELDEMTKENHLLNTMLDDLRRHHDIVQRELDLALESQHRSDSQLAESKERIRELEATVAALHQQAAAHLSAPTTPSSRIVVSQASPRKPPTRQAVN